MAQLSQIEKSIPDLVRQLAGDGNQLNALRLRISCRSAEWPHTLEAELRGIWDAEQVKVYELGHLREKDVRSAVEQLLAQAHSVELSSAAARWQRDDLERKKARAAEEGLREKVNAVALAEQELAKIDTNGSFDWWRLNMILFANQNGRLDPAAEFQSDLKKSRGWLSLSEESRKSVVSSARRYLDENFVRSKHWIGTQTFHRKRRSRPIRKGLAWGLQSVDQRVCKSLAGGMEAATTENYEVRP
ncbi:hypothetical protein JQ637_46455, partial [Bradyrhizobium diazoefficiens]|uniref:hypothetical protein n=2 Tax=Nitrobacteraceae TaxID=41294 RepID=UPI001B8D2888